jgi:O-antigen/teichoic acid export membrane protein
VNRPIDKKILRRAYWSATARLIGVGLGAGTGSLLYHLVGNGFQGWGIALILAVVSFALMLVAEYQREIQ